MDRGQKSTRLIPAGRFWADRSEYLEADCTAGRRMRKVDNFHLAVDLLVTSVDRLPCEVLAGTPGLESGILDFPRHLLPRLGRRLEDDFAAPSTCGKLRR